MQLVRSWQIPESSKILEIGCGQGEMTAVLADAVGSAGHVLAVDLGEPDYGSPLTLEQSLSRLKQTPLGARIDYRLNYDILEPTNSFAVDTFDCVVLAHCSWYFDSIDVLRENLLRIKPWATRLCFSEWDMEARDIDQVAHMLAVMIQGQVGVFNPARGNNVRTPISKARFKELLLETGWRITSEDTVDTNGMQDAAWEIQNCLVTSVTESGRLDLPPKFQEFIKSQADILTMIAGKNQNKPLPSYAITAERDNTELR